MFPRAVLGVNRRICKRICLRMHAGGHAYGRPQNESSDKPSTIHTRTDSNSVRSQCGPAISHGFGPLRTAVPDSVVPCAPV